jgi:phosphoglycolate phosphatase-like HAD superfamily hydrolase
MDISKYATLVFDCDGVVLDSNKVKTTAFYNAALPYGVAAAEALVEYHTKRGGISRYTKFEYFLEEIVGTKAEQKSLDKLLNDFAHEVKKGLLVCQISSGLKKLRQNTHSNWLLVSGGDQNELRDIFMQRNLVEDFDGGIFGSPDTKDTILAREIANGNIKLPALFIGDSKYDYQAATTANIDFVFAHDWTEVSNWREYCDENKLDFIDNISQLHNDATVVF